MNILRRLSDVAGRAGPPLLGLAGYLALFVYALPHHVIMKSDDFGYMLSIVDTISRGSMVTNGWLAPLAATNTAASIVIFFTTGSFYMATYGALVGYAALFFILLYFNLRPQLSRRQAALITFLVVMMPLVFYKLSDFTSSAQGWALFLAALLAFRRKNLLLFTLLTVLAFANRQNYVALFAMPCSTLVMEYFKRGKINIHALATVAGGIISCTIILKWFPDNFFRAHILSSFVTLDPLTIFTNALIYLFCFLFFCALTPMLARGPRRPVRLSQPWEWMLWGFGAICLLTLCIGSPSVIKFEAAPFSQMRSLLSRILAVLFVGGAFFAPVRKLPTYPLFWGAAALYAVNALNPFVWDYYLAEAMLFGLIIGSHEADSVPDRFPMFALLYVAACLVWIVSFAKQITATERQSVAYEQMLRSRTIAVREIPRSLFAFCQYKLFDFAALRYSQVKGLPYPDCGTYLGGSTVILSDANNMKLASGQETSCTQIALASDTAHMLAVANEKALRCPAAAPLAKLDEGFRQRPFPLNDLEWSRFIKEGVLSFSNEPGAR